MLPISLPQKAISYQIVLIAEAADLDLHKLGQLTAEVIDVDAGSAVDIGRILVGEEEGLHE
jgi:hypothetical protein